MSHQHLYNIIYHIIFEGPEKTTRGRVNESQSKFLEETRPISQNRPDGPLFQPGQDRTVIIKLSTFRTRLGITTETWNIASKTMCEIKDKNRIKEQFISSQTFHWIAGERVRKITVKKRFKPIILKSFDSLTQKLYQHFSTTIHTQDSQITGWAAADQINLTLVANHANSSSGTREESAETKNWVLSSLLL
jgi:hypothetical protein